jgi:hypothetical protein
VNTVVVVSSEVLTAVKTVTTLLWVVTPSGLASRYQYFGGNLWRRCLSETSVSVCESTRLYSPEEHQRRGNWYRWSRMFHFLNMFKWRGTHLTVSCTWKRFGGRFGEGGGMSMRYWTGSASGPLKLFLWNCRVRTRLPGNNGVRDKRSLRCSWYTCHLFCKN